MNQIGRKRDIKSKCEEKGRRKYRKAHISQTTSKDSWYERKFVSLEVVRQGNRGSLFCEVVTKSFKHRLIFFLFLPHNSI